MKKKQEKFRGKFISNLILILLFVEIVTYTAVYISLKFNHGNMVESVKFSLAPPIICLIVFLLLNSASSENNKSKSLLFLSIIASWVPCLLIYYFKDFAVLEITLNKSATINVLPLFSLIIGLLATIKYISSLTTIYINEKEMRKQMELEYMRLRRESHKRELEQKRRNAQKRRYTYFK
ncbi:hypothetical protein [Romboutsia lituseburensis]|uniref:hypothetical protein n=1 Tax=Romboutsia lituseburensis TaxID=1537 RepID=UPI00215A1789|nr:hypothetical protein [Romboutsia lituseburensis]MCR8743788.1 hypothetical protein [Romboutsia lituseburensis]